MSNHRVPGSRAPLEDANVRAARQGTVDARGVGPSGRYRLRCVVASPMATRTRTRRSVRCGRGLSGRLRTYRTGCSGASAPPSATAPSWARSRSPAPARAALSGPPGWTAVPGKVVLMTEVVLPVTIRDLTRQDLPSSAWGVSVWDVARLGRALERAERGEVGYLAVCPPSGLLVAVGGVDCTLGPGAGHLGAAGRPRGPDWYGPGAGKCGGAGLAHCPQVPARGWSLRASEGRSRPPDSLLCIRRDPAGRGGGLGDAGELVTRGD